MRRVASGYRLTEAPTWSPTGELWFSDVVGGGAHVLDSDGFVRVAIPDRRWIGGMVCHRDGGMVVTGRTIAHVDDQRGTRVLAERDGVVWNDATVDATGCVIVGGSWKHTTSTGAMERRGGVFRLDERGRLTELVGGLGIPNGLAVTPDGTLFYVDSATRLVWMCGLARPGGAGSPSVVVDLSTGAPSDYDFPPSLPTPDGIALDEAGGLWVALLGAGCVRRYVGGAIDLEVRVPEPLVTSVCFGGSDLRDLYVTTASPDDAAGSVHQTRAPHAGVAVPLAVV